MDEAAGDPDRDWYDDEDPTDTSISCPACQADVYDDVDQCPACGHWILADERYGNVGLWTPRGMRVVSVVVLAAFLGTIVLSILL